MAGQKIQSIDIMQTLPAGKDEENYLTESK